MCGLYERGSGLRASGLQDETKKSRVSRFCRCCRFRSLGQKDPPNLHAKLYTSQDQSCERLPGTSKCHKPRISSLNVRRKTRPMADATIRVSSTEQHTAAPANVQTRRTRCPVDRVSKALGYVHHHHHHSEPTCDMLKTGPANAAAYVLDEFRSFCEEGFW